MLFDLLEAGHADGKNGEDEQYEQGDDQCRHLLLADVQEDFVREARVVQQLAGPQQDQLGLAVVVTYD